MQNPNNKMYSRISDEKKALLTPKGNFQDNEDYSNSTSKTMANFDHKKYVDNLFRDIYSKFDTNEKEDLTYKSCQLWVANLLEESAIKAESMKIDMNQQIHNGNAKDIKETSSIYKVKEKRDSHTLPFRETNVKKIETKDNVGRGGGVVFQINENQRIKKLVESEEITNNVATPADSKATISIKSLLKNDKLQYNIDNFINNKERIVQIQSAWRSKSVRKQWDKMKENAFIIQRAFRKHLIEKFDLPDNYFFNEKFLRIQNEKYEMNLRENMAFLFPAIFSEEMTGDGMLQGGMNQKLLLKTGASLSQQINYNLSSNMLTFANNPTHNPYEPGKIHLFMKILDFDLMIETDESYENLWAKSFDLIYSNCIKNNAPLQMLALGGQHTLCVNNKGKIFTFGWNNYGQCGVPINSTIIAKEEIEKEYLVEVTKYGELKPRIINKVDGIKIPEIEEVILSKNIACGEDHSLILDHEGSVWAFGLNLNGQLGLGHQKTVEKPIKIQSLSKHFITTVRSEGDINFAVSDKGEAFMWPWSDKNGTINYQPIRLPLNTVGEKVSMVACGNNYCILLTAHGLVYSMGKTNNYGQLGQGDREPRLRPTMIEFFQINNERITQVSCGYKHCVAKSAIGHAFTWGMGSKGQLGHGDFNDYTLPYQVKVETPLSKVYQVSAGFRSTFFLIENRKVFVCGCNGTVSMQNIPVPFITWEKIPELSNELNYSIVRIMNSWNKSFSIFYATIADTTTMKVNPVKLNQILMNLATKWESETVDPPYIEVISSFFPIAYMKKQKEIYFQKK